MKDEVAGGLGHLALLWSSFFCNCYTYFIYDPHVLHP